MCSSINQTLFSVVLKTASSYCKRILNVKSKRIECFVGIEFRRTFTATKYRSARRIKQSFITPYNETNYTSSKREPNDFGKIISLDPSEVEEDCERRPLGNKKSKKKLDKSTLRKIELKEKDFNADSVFEDRVPKNNDDGELKDTNKIKSKSSQNNQSKELQYKSIKNHESLLW